MSDVAEPTEERVPDGGPEEGPRRFGCVVAVALAVAAVVFVILFFLAPGDPRTPVDVIRGEAMRLPALFLVPAVLAYVLTTPLRQGGSRVSRRLACVALALAVGVGCAALMPGGGLALARDLPYVSAPMTGTVRILGVHEAEAISDFGRDTTWLDCVVDDLPGHAAGDMVGFEVSSEWSVELIGEYGLTDPGVVSQGAASRDATDAAPLCRVGVMPGSQRLLSVERVAG